MCVALRRRGVRPFPCVPVPQHQLARIAAPCGRSCLSPFPSLSRSCHCRSSHRRRFAPPYCWSGVSVERRTGRRSPPVPLGRGTTWLDRRDLHPISPRPQVLSLPLLPFLPSSLALNGCLRHASGMVPGLLSALQLAMVLTHQHYWKPNAAQHSHAFTLAFDSSAMG